VCDPIDDYLAALERSLAVHPRRRDRIVLELESHLRESAERRGAAEAIARVGTPAVVARSFCASDHSDEIRLNYTGGAILLMVAYAWAVTGWCRGDRCDSLAGATTESGRSTARSPSVASRAITRLRLLPRRRRGDDRPGCV
jgi:hypothetical protein